MARGTDEYGYNRLLAISRTDESTFGTYDMNNAIQFYVPDGLGRLRSRKEVLSGADYATGKEGESERLFLAKNNGVQTVGGFWGSVELFGRLFGFGVGDDTVSTSGTSHQHAFEMAAPNAVLGGMSMADTGPQEEDADGAIKFEGNQVEEFTINIGRGSGFVRADAGLLPCDEAGRDEDIPTNYGTKEDSKLLLLNNKCSVFLARASTEGQSDWNGSTITQPTSGAAVTSNDINGTNISPYINSMSLTYKNNLDFDGAFGPGTATGAGVVRGQAYWQQRMVSGSINYTPQKSGIPADFQNIIKGLYGQDDGAEDHYTLQVVFTTDTELDTNKHAGMAIIVPLLVFDFDFSDSTGMGRKEITAPFHAQEESGSDLKRWYSWVWSDSATVYGRAA